MTSIFSQDWTANRGNLKGKLVVILFRLASFFRQHPLLGLFFFYYFIFYRFFVEWLLGIEIHWNVRAGHGLCLEHGQGSVINGGASLGHHCIIRHGTTIGNKRCSDGSYSASPRIGNYVDIGANVCIIGDIEIGDHVTIGAGSVVTKSIPAYCVVAGNPARIIRKLEPMPLVP